MSLKDREWTVKVQLGVELRPESPEIEWISLFHPISSSRVWDLKGAGMDELVKGRHTESHIIKIGEIRTQGVVFFLLYLSLMEYPNNIQNLFIYIYCTNNIL